jgi:hypothetical protein
LPKKKGRWLNYLLVSLGFIATAKMINYFYPEDFKKATTNMITRFPFELTSTAWGSIARTPLPLSLREPVYKTYAHVFGVHLEEIERPLSEYPSLAEFFARHLKKGVRVWEGKGVGSPVDGTVYCHGPITDHSIEQVGACLLFVLLMIVVVIVLCSDCCSDCVV